MPKVFGNGADNLRIGHHTNFHGIGKNVRKHRVNLCRDKGCVRLEMPNTPVVFCAVSAVMTLMPYSLCAAMVFKSA